MHCWCVCAAGAGCSGVLCTVLQDTGLDVVLLVLGAAAYVVRYYKALAFVHLVLPTFLLSLGGLLGAFGCGLIIKETEFLEDAYHWDVEYVEGEYLGFITSGICFFGGFTL
eukprot:Sspe_Gene.33530::Locus_16362_Transcript_2_3_Confidence_0.467_Length_570::g.33530::m.33530